MDAIGQAEALAGAEIAVPESALPAAADEGRYRIEELTGCDVATVGGETLGRVADVWESGGAAVLVIEGPGGREVLVPFSSAVCPVIDPAAKRIVIDPPDGLLDLNEI